MTSLNLFVLVLCSLICMVLCEGPYTLTTYSDSACTRNPVIIPVPLHSCATLQGGNSFRLATCSPRTVHGDFYQSTTSCAGSSFEYEADVGSCIEFPGGGYGIWSCGNNANQATIYALINEDGAVLTSSAFVNVTHIDTGHYCVDAAGVGTFVPVIATINSSQNGSTPGFIVANSAVADMCTGISIVSISIFDTKGNPMDAPFTVLINLSQGITPPPSSSVKEL